MYEFNRRDLLICKFNSIDGVMTPFILIFRLKSEWLHEMISILWWDIVKVLMKLDKNLCIVLSGKKTPVPRLESALSKEMINSDWYPDFTNNKNQVDDHY